MSVITSAKSFLCNRKLRSYYIKTLSVDAHCGVQCRCRKRPPRARECAKAHSLFFYGGFAEYVRTVGNS